MKLDDKISFYRNNYDEKAEDMISCYNKINNLKKTNEDLSTVEGIKNYYLECLLLNDYYNHSDIKNSLNFRKKKEFDKDIDLLFNTFKDIKLDNEFSKEIISTYGLFNSPITVKDVVCGFDKGKYYYIFNSYDLSDKQNLIGIKQFLSYVEFNNLVENGKYSEAIEVGEGHIETLKIVKKCFKDKNSTPLNQYIEQDFDLLTNDETANCTNWDDAFALVDEKDMFYRIKPTIKLLCNYYRALKNVEYKKYVLDLIRSFPFTDETDKLINYLNSIHIKEQIEVISKMYVDKEIENDDLLAKVDELTNNSDKLKEFENIEAKYRYINFNNISADSKRYVANANYVYMLLKDIKDDEKVDFSLAVMGWCKAAEKEFIDKLINPILNNKDVCNYLTEQDIRLYPITLGISKHLINHADYLFNNVYKEIYDGVNVGFFKSLFRQLGDLSELRNDADHTYYGQMDIQDATQCQGMVLKSQKILEYMSKVPTIEYYS